MKAREVLGRIRGLGGQEVRKGKGEDIKRGTLKGIESDLEGCAKFGKGWLTR